MSELKITVVIENNSSYPNLKSEHGLSFWLSIGDKNFIFDTGASSAAAANMKELALSPKDAEGLIISHGHYDHTGGIESIVGDGFDGLIYLHPDALQQKFSNSSSVARDISIPQGCKNVILDFQQANKVVLVEWPYYILDNCFMTGKIPRSFGNPPTNKVFFLDVECLNQDNLNDDMAMAIETSKGMVIVCGCAHSGIQNTIDYVLKLSQNKKIYAVLGGTHIKSKDELVLKEISDYLNSLEIAVIAPNHCTCQTAIAYLKENFKGSVIDFSGGCVFEI